MYRPLLAAFAGFALIAAADVALADSPLKVATPAFTPVAHPYDEAADAKADLAAAMDRAAKSGKQVMIDLGGNWCPDCRALSGALEVPEIKAYIAAHYEVVPVDIGRKTKNLDIPAHYGITLEGVPTVLVVDPKSDKLTNGDTILALGDARGMDPQAIADCLTKWAEKPAS